MYDLAYTALELFLISFVSNLVPFGGAPYTLIGSLKVPELGLPAVIATTALGAALAKVPLYYFGLELSFLLKKNRNYHFFQNWVKHRSFLVALFVTAFLPGLPLDDYLYIWAGSLKYKILKMLGVTLLSKLVKSSVEIPIEYYSLYFVSSTLHVDVFNNALLQVGLVLTFVVLGVILFLVDWESLISRTKSILSWALRSSKQGSSRFT